MFLSVMANNPQNTPREPVYSSSIPPTLMRVKVVLGIMRLLKAPAGSRENIYTRNPADGMETVFRMKRKGAEPSLWAGQ